MQIGDKRKIINRNSAIKTIVGTTIVIVILSYLGIKADHLILGSNSHIGYFYLFYT